MLPEDFYPWLDLIQKLNNSIFLQWDSSVEEARKSRVRRRKKGANTFIFRQRNQLQEIQEGTVRDEKTHIRIHC